MSRPQVEQLSWKSSQLRLVTLDMFPTYYPPAVENPTLVQRLKDIGGKEIEIARLYGSVASGAASKTSLTNIFVVVRNPVVFYDQAAASGKLKLGTMKDSSFHALWGEQKQNFYLTTDGKAKIWVATHRELPKHAKGAMPGIEGGKGKGYAAGRMQKTEFPLLFTDQTDKEKGEIDLAFNQARLAGVWLALGLAPRVCTFDQVADIYANLSYMADKRVEKANKSAVLVERNYDHYVEMLTPILDRFAEKGILRQIEEGVYEKRMSLVEEDVRKWLKEEASSAFKTNFLKNTWTMGPLNGILYGLAKVKRIKGR